MTVNFVLAHTEHGPLLINRHDYHRSFDGRYYGVGAQLMENGCYDRRDVELTSALLELRHEHHGSGVFAIDGGANIGVFSVEWARRMRGWGEVLAVEAQERVFYALAGNLILHNADNARARWAALGKTDGEEIRIPEPDYSQPSSFGSFELFDHVGREYIGQALDYRNPRLRVRQISVDALELPRLDLLKLDLEGMEMEAIAGARQTIATLRPMLFVETMKGGADVIREALTPHGYRLFPHGINLLAVHESDPCLGQIQVATD
jgi:FkbM family methyltransferase